MKFSIKDFFSKWSHLLKKTLMENFIFCAVKGVKYFEELTVPFDCGEFLSWKGGSTMMFSPLDLTLHGQIHTRSQLVIGKPSSVECYKKKIFKLNVVFQSFIHRYVS